MKRSAVLVVAVALGSCGHEKSGHEVVTEGTLVLLRERSFADLLSPHGRYEGSGVALKDGVLHVVFDNSTQVAAVDPALSACTLGPGGKASSNYEGITFATHPSAKTFVVDEEGVGDRTAIITLDANGKLVSTEPTDLTFRDPHKGIEGIAWLDDIDRLLVLCEANSCGEGDQSPGHGVIKSLRRESGAWLTETRLALPARADFEDYSDLAVLANAEGSYQMAIVTQQGAALWLGTLTTNPLAIYGAGTVYGLPKVAGTTAYCSIEGVTFLDRSTLALVSDQRKEASGCTKAESVHVFALP